MDNILPMFVLSEVSTKQYFKFQNTNFIMSDAGMQNAKLYCTRNGPVHKQTYANKCYLVQ